LPDFQSARGRSPIGRALQSRVLPDWVAREGQRPPWSWPFRPGVCFPSVPRLRSTFLVRRRFPQGDPMIRDGPQPGWTQQGNPGRSAFRHVDNRAATPNRARSKRKRKHGTNVGKGRLPPGLRRDHRRRRGSAGARFPRRRGLKRPIRAAPAAVLLLRKQGPDFAPGRLSPRSFGPNPGLFSPASPIFGIGRIPQRRDWPAAWAHGQFPGAAAVALVGGKAQALNGKPPAIRGPRPGRLRAPGPGAGSRDGPGRRWASAAYKGCWRNTPFRRGLPWHGPQGPISDPPSGRRKKKNTPRGCAPSSEGSQGSRPAARLGTSTEPIQTRRRVPLPIKRRRRCCG